MYLIIKNPDTPKNAIINIIIIPKPIPLLSPMNSSKLKSPLIKSNIKNTIIKEHKNNADILNKSFSGILILYIKLKIISFINNYYISLMLKVFASSKPDIIPAAILKYSLIVIILSFNIKKANIVIEIHIMEKNELLISFYVILLYVFLS